MVPFDAEEHELRKIIERMSFAKLPKNYKDEKVFKEFMLKKLSLLQEEEIAFLVKSHNIVQQILQAESLIQTEQGIQKKILKDMKFKELLFAIVLEVKKDILIQQYINEYVRQLETEFHELLSKIRTEQENWDLNVTQHNTHLLNIKARIEIELFLLNARISLQNARLVTTADKIMNVFAKLNLEFMEESGMNAKQMQEFQEITQKVTQNFATAVENFEKALNNFDNLDEKAAFKSDEEIDALVDNEWHHARQRYTELLRAKYEKNNVPLEYIDKNIPVNAKGEDNKVKYQKKQQEGDSFATSAVLDLISKKNTFRELQTQTNRKPSDLQSIKNSEQENEGHSDENSTPPKYITDDLQSIAQKYHKSLPETQQYVNASSGTHQEETHSEHVKETMQSIVQKYSKSSPETQQSGIGRSDTHQKVTQFDPSTSLHAPVQHRPFKDSATIAQDMFDREMKMMEEKLNELAANKKASLKWRERRAALHREQQRKGASPHAKPNSTASLHEMKNIAEKLVKNLDAQETEPTNEPAKTQSSRATRAAMLANIKKQKKTQAITQSLREKRAKPLWTNIIKRDQQRRQKQVQNQAQIQEQTQQQTQAQPQAQTEERLQVPPQAQIQEQSQAQPQFSQAKTTQGESIHSPSNTLNLRAQRGQMMKNKMISIDRRPNIEREHEHTSAPKPIVFAAKNVLPNTPTSRAERDAELQKAAALAAKPKEGLLKGFKNIISKARQKVRGTPSTPSAKPKKDL